jgi:hypothetical protein
MLRDYAHYSGLTRFKETQAIENRNNILMSLHRLKNPSSVDEIYNHFKEMTKEKINRLYDNAEIDSNEKKLLVKEGTLNKRTIHRWLNALLNEGFVERNDRKYSISEYGKNVHIYMARSKGDDALFELLDSYHPHTLKFESNVQELIKIFGIYMMYCFIDVAYPLERYDNKTRIVGRDRYSDSYVDAMIHPLSLFNAFMTVFGSLSNIDIDLAKQNWDNNYKRVKNEKGRFEDFWVDYNGKQVYPASAWGLLLLRLRSEENLFDRITKPMNELDEHIIDRIKEVLKKRYHNYYKSLFEKGERIILSRPDIRELLEELRIRRIHYLDKRSEES